MLGIRLKRCINKPNSTTSRILPVIETCSVHNIVIRYLINTGTIATCRLHGLQLNRIQRVQDTPHLFVPPLHRECHNIGLSVETRAGSITVHTELAAVKGDATTLEFDEHLLADGNLWWDKQCPGGQAHPCHTQQPSALRVLHSAVPRLHRSNACVERLCVHFTFSHRLGVCS